MRGAVISLSVAGLIVLCAAAQDTAPGIAEYEGGKLAAAERSLRAALTAHPEDARARYYLVLALLQQNKAADAGAAARAIEQSAPDSPYARLALARVYVERKEFDQAEAELNGAAGKLDSANPDLRYVRGILEAARKNFKAAADDLQVVIEKQPQNAYAHYYAALAYNGLKRPDLMVNHFERFLQLAPEAPEAAKVRSVLQAMR